MLARGVSLGDLGSEPAYIVGFSTRGGAKLQYYFGVRTSLITEVTDVRGSLERGEDYRAENGILEPHRLRVGSDSEVTYLLQSAKYNIGISDASLMRRVA